MTSTTFRRNVQTSSLSAALLRRLVWNVAPAVIVLLALHLALAGDEGLFKRHDLKQRLFRIESEVARLNGENAALRVRIDGLRNDPVAVRRAAAHSLLMAEPGSTIYRFSPRQVDAFAVGDGSRRF